MIVWLLLIVAVIAFVLEFLDASLGMSYGEITVILILFGFAPLEVIPAVIFTSAVLSLLAGILHHQSHNVDFSFKTKEFRITGVLTGFGIVGILIGALIASSIAEWLLLGYIGLLVIFMGVKVLLQNKNNQKFSWPKIIGLGSVAAFNKGMSGGGYGPVLASGQIIAGIESKKAVAITALTEGIVSFFGFLVYFLITGSSFMNWPLITALLLGGLFSTPLAVYAVKRFKMEGLKRYIGIVTIILGTLMLAKLFF